LLTKDFFFKNIKSYALQQDLKREIQVQTVCFSEVERFQTDSVEHAWTAERDKTPCLQGKPTPPRAK
jgi:hypothetical protein